MAVTKKPAKMDRGARLAALRDKIKNTDLGGGGGAGFWSPKEGANVIRILPEVGDMPFFFQTVGRHYFPPDGKKNVYCPKFTTEGERECPVCEIVEDLYKSGDAANKTLAGQLRVRKQYWMNVIDRSADKDKTAPLIYTPGQKVFGSIVALIQDPDYGDIHDIEQGLDITINRSGKGLETEYEVVPRRKASPLSQDPDKAAEWIEKAKDLSWAEVSEDPDEDKELSSGHAVYILPYDRIVKDHDLDDPDFITDEEEDDDVDEEDEDEDEDEDEEDPPTTRPARRAPTRTARRSTRR